MTPVVEGARNVLVLGTLPDWQALGLTLAFGLLVMQFGYAWFVKSKRGFSDVL
jgi:lipopolysaccharide transport system permease protein